MKTVFLAIVLILVVLASADSRAAAEDVIPSGPFAGMVLVSLHEGANELHLEGNAVVDTIFRGWRENGNAHGFNLATFYRHAQYEADRFSPARDRWEIIPFFGPNQSVEVDSYRDFRGADCVLEDLFLLRAGAGANKPTMAVIAKREFGATFIDSMPVTFDYYELKKEAVTVGRPEVFFANAGSVKSKGKYCDVADAMNKEFGVGPKFQYR